MKAVFDHELKNYFHSLTAYIFGAFLLIFTGIGAMMYNINAAVSNFEYVLSFCSIVFIVLFPVLTMRVFSEERKQKTDQLLYSLPISAAEVVLGKYFALLIVYLIPVAIISFYPLVFSKFGDVFLPTSYGSLFAFFLMGAALIALGEFISSLTDNQGLAAGICIAVILFNYFSVSLSEYVSTTSFSSLMALTVIALLLALIVYALTKNSTLAYIIGFVMIAVLLVIGLVNIDLLEGLLPNIMKKLSLFEQFDTFVSGVFDLKAIVYYLSVIVFFLFLSVQSLEKRRYN